jgi:hypothetical protein
MSPLQRVPLDHQSLAACRADLMAKPREFFRGVFGGRIPTEQEKLNLIEQSLRRMAASATYRNDLYVVQVESVPPFVHLNIHRHDWAPCNDWRHFQQIKNELVGTENEAVELFPAESRLVDTSNTYHLWVHADASFRFPLGLQHRLVTSEAIGLEAQRAVAV